LAFALCGPTSRGYFVRCGDQPEANALPMRWKTISWKSSSYPAVTSSLTTPAVNLSLTPVFSHRLTAC
jgi:hypothetical protein